MLLRSTQSRALTDSVSPIQLLLSTRRCYHSSFKPSTVTSYPAPTRGMPLRAKILPASASQGNPKRTMGSRDLMYPPAENPEDEVMFSSNYAVRSILLNRPKKYNALSGSMAKKILMRLQEWENSQLANIIVLKGAGDKAFCAGGDVAELATSIMIENTAGVQKAKDYFALEYTLDHMIGTYSKPVVAFMDGITMGGGVGLSVHAPFRIATERTVFAMPETKIGFFPDVGGSFFLPRLDGQVGTYLGLTGELLRSAHVLFAGIATHYIHSSSLSDLEGRLAELKFNDYASLEEKYRVVDSTIEEFNTGLPDLAPYPLTGEIRELIDRCFSPNTMPEIFSSLQSEINNDDGDYSDHPLTPTAQFASATLQALQARCPLSLQVTLQLLRYGANWPISECFHREFVLASRFMTPPHNEDFLKGVHKVLIQKDKDSIPEWNQQYAIPPMHDLAAIARSTNDITADFFTPEPDLDKRLPLRPRYDYTVYPHRFLGLPAEEDIRAVAVDPEVKRSKKDVVEFFVEKTNAKIGVREKVVEVLERMVVVKDDGLLGWKSDWVPPPPPPSSDS